MTLPDWAPSLYCLAHTQLRAAGETLTGVFPTLQVWDVAIVLEVADMPKNDSECSTARC